VGIFLFIRITGGTAEPSEPISAPTLSIPTAVPTDAAAVSTLPTALPTSIPNPTQAPTIVPTTPVSTSPQLFRIVPEASEARFSVYETFPEGTAVGRTNQIAGDILVDANNPPNSQIGTIRINLRTLRTDDPDRDRSIRCCVLLTAQDAYEFTDFVPTATVGLPSQVQIGDTFSFQVTGDLSLRGNVRSVTFDVTLTASSADEIRGSATATVNRTDFGILNDDRNGFDYHGVEGQVTLAFDFVARAVAS